MTITFYPENVLVINLLEYLFFVKQCQISLEVKIFSENFVLIEGDSCIIEGLVFKIMFLALDLAPLRLMLR